MNLLLKFDSLFCFENNYYIVLELKAFKKEKEFALKIIDEIANKYPENIERIRNPFTISVKFEQEFLINLLFYLILNYNLTLKINNEVVRIKNYNNDNYLKICYLIEEFIKIETVRINNDSNFLKK